MTKTERAEKEKELLRAMLFYENKLRLEGCDFIAGVDEAGRGPLAGPVAAAAVMLPEDFDVYGVNDSKKLTKKKRDFLFDEIKEAALSYAVVFKSPEKIDKINILEATKEAMKEAVLSLNPRPCHVLIDAVEIENLGIASTSIIKGDSLSVSIAAASIMAKVTRDRYMEKLSKIYPGYSFEKNKGYGTREHYEALAKLGPSPVHRKTFLKKTNRYYNAEGESR